MKLTNSDTLVPLGTIINVSTLIKTQKFESIPHYTGLKCYNKIAEFYCKEYFDPSHTDSTPEAYNSVEEWNFLITFI